MDKGDQTMQSNPARTAAARLVVGCVGAVLIYVALPHPFDSQTWWRDAALPPLAAGAFALVLALVAPTSWCEALL
jgi:hypothetical protein